MDVEVIIKRALVYAAALAAIAAMYAILLKLVGAIFPGSGDKPTFVIALLATIVVVLLSRPVKNAIQNALDRVYYRDRYDYRRALVGFARDLNSDLDLHRLSERLVHRVGRRWSSIAWCYAGAAATNARESSRRSRTSGSPDSFPAAHGR